MSGGSCCSCYMLSLPRSAWLVKRSVWSTTRFCDEGLVDAQQGPLLLRSELGVVPDRRLDTRRQRVVRRGVHQAGLRKHGGNRHLERMRQRLEHLGRRTVQAPLDLTEIGLSLIHI